MTLKKFIIYLQKHPHLKITLYFLLFGFLWILLSDRALNILYPDVERAYQLQTYKGWFFILITAILIYFSSKTNFRKILRLSSSLKSSETFLKQNEKLYEILLNNIPNTDIYLFDHQLNILKATGIGRLDGNPTILNYVGKKIHEVLSPEISEILKPIYQKTLEGSNQMIQYNLEEIDYMIYAAPVSFTGKDINAGVLVSQNITELKKIQKELSNRNIFIETILNNLPIGLAVHSNEDGKAVYMNKKFEEIYGWPLQDENIETFFNIVYSDPDYRKKIKEMVMKDISSGNPKRMVWENIHITTSKGNHRIISARNIPIKDQNLMVSMVNDVTENRKAERLIMENRNRYKAIFEYSPFPIWEQDFSQVKMYIENLKRKGISDFEVYLSENPKELKYISGLIQIIDANQATLKLFGANSKKELIDKVFSENSRNFLETFRYQLTGIFNGETSIEFTQKNKDLRGNKLYLKLKVNITPGHEDDFKHVLVSVGDITDITLTQKKLQEEKHKADIAIESSGLGYWETDYSSNINIINDQYARMLEYERKEFHESFSNFIQHIHPDDIIKINKAVSSPNNQIQLEVRMKTKSKKWKWISINGIVLERDASGKALRAIGTHRDLSFEREKEKILLKSFIEGKDKERKRMARELHDSLGQSLTAANLSLDFVRNEDSNLSPAALEHLSIGIDQLKEAIEETRNIAHDLLPRTVEDFGLIPGIKNLISNIQKTTSIKLYFFENIGDAKIDQERELHLYRIIQEALNNSIKHSECTRIDLQLIRHDSTLTITIEDNGKGFNINEFDASHPGFGLRNIEIRCKAISGEFNIETSPGRGTTIIVELEEI